MYPSRVQDSVGSLKPNESVLLLLWKHVNYSRKLRLVVSSFLKKRKKFRVGLCSILCQVLVALSFTAWWFSRSGLDDCFTMLEHAVSYSCA